MILFPTPEVPNDYLGRVQSLKELYTKVCQWVYGADSMMYDFMDSDDIEAIHEKLEYALNSLGIFKTILVAGQGYGVGGVHKYQVLNALAGEEVRSTSEHHYRNAIYHINGAKFLTGFDDEVAATTFKDFDDVGIVVRAVSHIDSALDMEVDESDYIESEDYDHAIDEEASVIVVTLSMSQLDNYYDEEDSSNDYYDLLFRAIDQNAKSFIFVLTGVEQLYAENDADDCEELIEDYLDKCEEVLENCDLESCPIFFIGDVEAVDDEEGKEFLMHDERGVVAFRKYVAELMTPDESKAGDYFSSEVSELAEIVKELQELVIDYDFDFKNTEEAMDHLYFVSKMLKKIDKNLYRLHDEYRESI